MGLTKNNQKVNGVAPSERAKPQEEPVKVEDLHEPEMVEYTLQTSWDDGGFLDLRIASMLKKYNLPGVFYIIVDKVGTQGYMTWDEVKSLDRAGFKIGAHTMSHPSDLKALHDEQLHYEIQNSKDMIEAVLGHQIYSFCYPRGRFDDRVIDFVAKAGFVEARTTGTPGISTFDSPFKKPGTIHIFQRPEYEGKPIAQFAKETVDRVKKEGGYFNIWGHSKEIEENNLWGVLDEVLAYVRL